MSILNELLDWCESNCVKISDYYEDISESLAYYSTPISSQSNCFVCGLRYYFNAEDKIVYIYCGKGKDLFTDNAAAITINCNKNSAIYSYYKILDEDSIPVTVEEKYWSYIENWNKENYVFEKLSIISAIDEFNNYASTNIKITLEDNDKIISDQRLDKLVYSDDWEDRELAAEQGYGLDILINDKVWDVRAAVAKQGYGLDKLINDESEFVRAEVARQGYCLDKLVNDESKFVRREVAEYGYGLDKLVNDKDPNVRKEVAEHGYGLDKLINDGHPWVYDAVQFYLKEHNYKSLEDWIRQNPDKLCSDNDLQLINDIKDFIYKIDDSNMLKIESSYESIDAFFDDKSKESYESNESIVILSVDTKVPLIKLEKALKDEKHAYKFIVDITNEDGDNFSIKTTIKSKENLYEKLQETIESLSLYKEFAKYADDLKNCL